MKKIWKTALKNSLATAFYIFLVGGFMYYGGEIKLGRTNTVLIPISLLLLFVCSAAITGFLIFGKPVQMYLDGQKKEALSLLSKTLVVFSLITLIFLTLLIIFSR